MTTVFRCSPSVNDASRRRHARRRTASHLNNGSSPTSAKSNRGPPALLPILRCRDGSCVGLVHILPDVLTFESRQFPLRMGYRVCFAGERVTPFSGFGTTNWTFKVYCVHDHSLRRQPERSSPVIFKLHPPRRARRLDWRDGGRCESPIAVSQNCH
jgi:hypothetical protein